MPFSCRLPRLKRYGALAIIRNLTAALIYFGFTFLSVGTAQADPVTIAALGDSLVQGYGLARDDGFVPQLQKWLTDQGLDIVLVNAGVSGDTTAGGLSRVDWTLTPDVDALIVSLGGNDALRGVDPATVRANLDGILAAAAARPVPVLLIGINPPNNFGDTYRQEFSAIYPELAARYATLFYPNFLQALADLPDRAQALADYFQSDALHPNKSGVALIVQDIGPSVASLAALAQNN